VAAGGCRWVAAGARSSLRPFAAADASVGACGRSIGAADGVELRLRSAARGSWPKAAAGGGPPVISIRGDGFRLLAASWSWPVDAASNDCPVTAAGDDAFRPFAVDGPRSAAAATSGFSAVTIGGEVLGMFAANGS